MNRHERRAKDSAFKKQIKQVLKTEEWGEWENQTIAFKEKCKNENVFGFWGNLIYSVQGYYNKNNNGIVIGIRRHDQNTDIPWSHKQRIKNEIFGDGSFFVECFPSEDSLIDQANMYWMFKIEDESSYTNESFNLTEFIGRN